MSTRSEYAPGVFCWVDLSTTDPDAAVAFYTSLLGLEAEAEQTPGGGAYVTFLEGGRRAAGAFSGRADAWYSYVTVDDVDASAARAEDLGADVVAGPRDVEDLGRVAYLQDPQGASIGLWQPGTNHGAEVVNEPGTLTWNDLVVPGLDTAKGFYGKLFGWTFQDAPPGGGIRYSVVMNGDRSNGGIMEMADTPPHWRPYFVVPNADDAAARIPDLGGRVIAEPMEVPAGRICVALDPQGAIFGVFEGEVDD